MRLYFSFLLLYWAPHGQDITQHWSWKLLGTVSIWHCWKSQYLLPNTTWKGGRGEFLPWPPYPCAEFTLCLTFPGFVHKKHWRIDYFEVRIMCYRGFGDGGVLCLLFYSSKWISFLPGNARVRGQAGLLSERRGSYPVIDFRLLNCK